LNEEILKNIYSHLKQNALTDSDYNTWKNNFTNNSTVRDNVYNYLQKNKLTDSNKITWEKNIGLFNNTSEELDTAKQEVELSGIANTAIAATESPIAAVAQSLWDKTKKTFGWFEYDDENISKVALDNKFSDGTLDITKYSNEDLNEIYGNKPEKELLFKQAQEKKQNLQRQLNDEGFFEGLGDLWARTGFADQDVLDTENGKININLMPNVLTNPISMWGVGTKPLYMSPEEILKLKYHPNANEDPNNPLNKHLRGIQNELASAESLQFEANAMGTLKKMQLTDKRLKKVNNELELQLGKGGINKLYDLGEKINNKQATEQEQQEYNQLLEKFNESGYGEEFLTLQEQSEGMRQEIESLEGEYGTRKKVKLLEEAISIENDNRRRTLGWGLSTAEWFSTVFNETIERGSNMPEDVADYVGVGAEWATGSNLGVRDKLVTESITNRKDIDSTKQLRGLREDIVRVGNYEVTLDGNEVAEVYDKDGYLVRNKELARQIAGQAQRMYDADPNVKEAKWNLEAGTYGLRETTPDLLNMFVTGGFANSIGKAALSGLSKVDKMNTLVRGLATGAFKATSNARFIEAAGMAPVFVGQTMKAAIESGEAFTPGQIFAASTVNLGADLMAEVMFPTMGKFFADKGITPAIFSRAYKDKLKDVIQHYSTGKLSSADVTRAFVQAGKDVVEGFGGEMAEEALIALAQPLINNYILNPLLNTTFDPDFDINDFLSSALIGGASGAMMASPKAALDVWGMKGNTKEYYKGLLSDVIKNTNDYQMKNAAVEFAPAFQAQLDDLVEKGHITKENANKYGSAIARANNSTKFLEDTNQAGKTNDSVETFNKFARNIAFNTAILESAETDNEVSKAINSAKANANTQILKELQENQYKGVYSIMTPTYLNQISDTPLSQEVLANFKETIYPEIMDKVANMKVKDSLKAEIFDLKIKRAHKEANIKQLKGKDNLSKKEQEQLAKDTAEVETLKKQEIAVAEEAEKITLLDKKRKQEDLTPEEAKKVTTIEQQSIGDSLKRYGKVTTDDGSVAIDMDFVDELKIKYPDQVDFIDEQIAKLRGKTIEENNKSTKEAIQKVKSTKEIGLQRYANAPQLEQEERSIAIQKVLDDYEAKLIEEGLSSEQIEFELDQIKNELDNRTTEELYNSSPDFKNVLDDITSVDVKTYEKPTETPKEPSDDLEEDDISDELPDDIDTDEQLDKALDELDDSDVIIIGDEGVDNLDDDYEGYDEDPDDLDDSEESTFIQDEVIDRLKEIPKGTLSKDSNTYEVVVNGVKKAIQRVSNFIGKTVYGTKQKVTNMFGATTVGNQVDLLGRLLFDNSKLTYKEFKRIFDKESKNKNLSQLVTEQEFDKLKEGILTVKNQISEKYLGIKFLTSEHLFYNLTKSLEDYDGVGGTTDILGIDTEGNIHIFDLKSIKSSNRSPVTQQSVRKDFTEQDGTESISNHEKWSKQQKLYAELLKNLGFKVGTQNIVAVPVNYTNEPFEGDPKNDEEINNYTNTVKPTSPITSPIPAFLVELTREYDSVNQVIQRLRDAFIPKFKNEEEIKQAMKDELYYKVHTFKVISEKNSNGKYEVVNADDGALLDELDTIEEANARVEELNAKAALEKEQITNKYNKLLEDFRQQKQQDKEASQEVKKEEPKKATVTLPSGIKSIVDITPFKTPQADDLLVLEYLQEGDPMFIEAKSNIVHVAAYFDKKAKRFTNDKSGQRVLVGTLNANSNKATQSYVLNKMRSLNQNSIQISLGVNNLNYKNSFKKDEDSKDTALLNPTVEALEALRPYLYVLGASFSEDESLLLDDKGSLTPNDILISLEEKYLENKGVPLFKDVDGQRARDFLIEQLEDPNNWGKVIAIVGNQLVLFNTIPLSNDQVSLDKLDEELEEGSKLPKGKPINITVAVKRDPTQPNKGESPNIRGSLIKFYSDGKGGFYKVLNEKDEKGKYVTKPYTKEQIKEELSEIRVQIDDKALRDPNNKDVLELASRVLQYRGQENFNIVHPMTRVTLPIFEDKNLEEKSEPAPKEEEVVAQTQNEDKPEEKPNNKPSRLGSIKSGNQKKLSVEETEVKKSNLKVDERLLPHFFDNKESTTAVEILNKVANSRSPMNKVAKQLLKYIHVNNVTLYIDDVENYITYDEDGNLVKGRGYYDRATNTIRIARHSLHKNGRSEALLMHEILHAITYDKLREGGKYVEDLIALYDRARQVLGPYKKGRKESSYGLYDLDEFIVAIFTNADFAAKLTKIPAVDGINYINLLHQIYDWLLSLINITPKDDNLYEQAMSVASYILEDVRRSSVDVYNFPKPKSDRVSDNNVEFNENDVKLGVQELFDVEDSDDVDYSDAEENQEFVPVIPDTPSFKISNWTNKNVGRYSNFIVKTLLRSYLLQEYQNDNINEIIKDKKLSVKQLVDEFKTKLKEHKDKYILETKDREELNESEVASLELLLGDILVQLKTNNTFNFIVTENIKKIAQDDSAFNDIDEQDAQDQVDSDNQSDDNTVAPDADLDPEHYTQNQSKIDSRKRASKRLREFFSGFPKKTLKINPDTKQFFRTNVVDFELFATEYYEGSYIHNKLLLELLDKNDYQDFIQAINDLQKTYSWGIDIVQQILNIKADEAVELFNKGALEIPLDALTNPEKYPNMKTWVLTDMYYAIGDQTNRNKVTLINDARGENGSLINAVQNDDYKNALEIFRDIAIKIRTDESLKAEYLPYAEELVKKLNSNNYNVYDISEFFDNLGFNSSSELLLHVNPLTNGKFKIDGISSNALMRMAINSFSDYIKTGKVTSLTSFSEKVATLVDKYQTSSSGLSFLNVNGEMEFAAGPSYNIKREFNKIKKNINAWIESKTKHEGRDVLMHSRMDFYEDARNDQHHYELFEDGFVKTANQENSGKEYKNYTAEDFEVNTINAFVASASEDGKKGKGIMDTKGSTVRHGLFHWGVFSDSIARLFLRAPIFSKQQIVDRLSNIAFGELERMRYAKQGIFKNYKNLHENGKHWQTLGELNEVEVTLADNKTISLYEFLTRWEQNSNASTVDPWASVTIEGITYPNPGTKTLTHKEFFNRIVGRIAENYYNNFIDKLVEKKLIGFKDNKMVKPSKSRLYDAFFTEGLAEEYYYNKFYNNIMTQIVFLGDPASYKKNKNDIYTDTDIVKRAKEGIAPTIAYPTKDKSLPMIIIKDIEVETAYFTKMKDGKKSNVKASLSDAGAYHTIARRREIIEANDPKSPLLAVLDRLHEGNYPETPEGLKQRQSDLDTVFQAQKNFLFTNLNYSTDAGVAVSVPYQIKNAEHILLPSVAYEVEGKINFVRPVSIFDIENPKEGKPKYKHPELAKLLFLMEKNNIKIAVYDTGTKAEVFNVLDLDQINDTNYILKTKDNNWIIDPTNASMGEQQINVEKHLDKMVNVGSQVQKEMGANIDDDATVTFNGVTYKGQAEIKNLLENIVKEDILYNEKKDILKAFYDKNGKVLDDKVYELITSKSLENGVDLNKLLGLSRQEDGKPLAPIELFGKKIQQIFHSKFKKVSRFKAKGAAYVNMPSVGFINRNVENKPIPSRSLEVKTKKVNGKEIIEYWEAMVPVYDPIIYQYIDENGELLLDKNGKPLIPEKLLHGFFYRIPTEDKYSTYHIKIVKFLPQAQGGVIVLPKEATEMTGLDFDVDKLFGLHYTAKVREDKDLLKTVQKYIKEATEGKLNYTEAEIAEFLDQQREDTLPDDLKDILILLLDGARAVYYSDKAVTTGQVTVDIVEPNIKTKSGRDNMRLDTYIAISQTPGFKDSAFEPGNKKRLIDFRDKKGTPPKRSSFADPVNEADTAVRNITGKGLVGVFANANAFYKLLQGTVVLGLKEPVTIDGQMFTTIGDKSSKISRALAEVLFASTEDVKDPVLEPAGINLVSAPVFLLLVSLTNKDSKGNVTTLDFNRALEYINQPDFKMLVQKAQNENKRLSDIVPRNSRYEKIINLASEYSDLISSVKIDTQIGPDFYAVFNKMTKLNSLYKKWEGGNSLISNLNQVIPASDTDNTMIINQSQIGRYNEYFRLFLKELNDFKKYFSFLNSEYKAILSEISALTNTGKLPDKLTHKLSYYLYDIIIHRKLDEMGILSDLITNVPSEFDDITNFDHNSLELRNHLHSADGIISMKKINTTGTTIIEELQDAFTALFDYNPEFAERLATYSLTRGTGFKMDNFAKILPATYWNTPTGKVMRNILNGNSTVEDVGRYTITFNDLIDNHFFQIFRKLKKEEVDSIIVDLDQFESNKSLPVQFKGEVPTFKDKNYVWYETNEGIKVLLVNASINDVPQWEVIKVKRDSALEYTANSRKFLEQKQNARQAKQEGANLPVDIDSISVEDERGYYPDQLNNLDDTFDDSELDNLSEDDDSALDNLVEDDYGDELDNLAEDDGDEVDDLSEEQEYTEADFDNEFVSNSEFKEFYRNEIIKNPSLTNIEILTYYKKCK
jgi:hypothetical protein